jgi:hypothetical protein
MSANVLDPTRCPLCGVQNECGIAAGQSECWCFDVTIQKQTLDQLPDAARGVACICKTCAAKEAENAAASTTNES